jgi:hypothetical protein
MKSKSEMKSVPYGLAELNSEIVMTDHPAPLVKCYVRGCDRWLAPPRRGFRGDVCPIHQIRCHISGHRGTFSYVDPVRNIIAGEKVFADHILGHPFKFESHRLGSEKSEDALTWNVFRFLYEQKELARVAELFTGERHLEEPQLFLWGIAMDNFRPWSLLIQARERFEANLPVDRPLTEPDIALYLPGEYLVLIEAKFTSPNTFYEHSYRKDATSLTAAELIHYYWYPDSRIVDADAASEAVRIPQQLWRNMVFAEYMAQQDGQGTRAYHATLVRRTYEPQIEDEFRLLLAPEFAHRFCRQTWENIHISITDLVSCAPLAAYLENKTAGLIPAFFLNRK